MDSSKKVAYVGVASYHGSGISRVVTRDLYRCADKMFIGTHTSGGCVIRHQIRDYPTAAGVFFTAADDADAFQRYYEKQPEIDLSADDVAREEARRQARAGWTVKEENSRYIIAERLV